ncbi:free fatty acid receptor 2-like [Strix uralensis]|uniref:free fatty acid receptor 2-like n=1 Tax=Strix uralensis TaxID=36305 RepID=UPI003DA3649F
MLVLTVYILTFSIGLPANVFTFIILLGKTRRGVSSSDILLLNLTAADLLLLLFLPFKMAETAAGMTWPLPIVLCPVANFCFYSSIYLSSLFLAALSVERYLGVVFPLQFQDRRRPARAMAASVVLWLLACSHCSVVFVTHYHRGVAVNGVMANGVNGVVVNGVMANGVMANGVKVNGVAVNGVISNANASNPSTPNGANLWDLSAPTDTSQTPNGSSSSSPNATDVYKCYDDFSDDQLSFVLPLRFEVFLLLFLLPFAITIFCYINFIRVLLARPNIPSEKKQRAIGLAVATVVNFGVCFAPYNVSHVVGFVEKRSPDWRVYALVFTSLNAALDPFVFYFSSTTVQKAVVKVVVTIGDKLRAVGGWFYGTCSPEASQEESEGSLT